MALVDSIRGQANCLGAVLSTEVERDKVPLRYSLGILASTECSVATSIVDTVQEGAVWRGWHSAGGLPSGTLSLELDVVELWEGQRQRPRGGHGQNGKSPRGPWGSRLRAAVISCLDRMPGAGSWGTRGGTGAVLEVWVRRGHLCLLPARQRLENTG